MQSLPSLDFSSSGGVPLLPLASPYQAGALTRPAKTPSPTRILPRLYMATTLLAAHGLLPEVELARLLALHHHGVGDELGDAAQLDARRPVVADVRERRAVDGAAGGEDVDAVLLLHVLHGVAAREAAAEAHLHVLLRADPRAAAAAEGLLADGVLRHLEEVPAHVLDDVPRLLEHAHPARRVAGVVERHAPAVVAGRVELQLAVLDEVRRELHDVDHLGRAGVLEPRAGHGRDRDLEEVRGSVHRVHVLVQHAPHVAALAAQDPLHSQALRLGVDLGVEPLHHVGRGEHAEVAALRGVRAPGEVEPDLVEEGHVAHARVDARLGQEVARGRDEEDLGALLVDGHLDLHPRHLLDVFGEELEGILEAVRLDPQVVPGPVAVGHRLDDPVDVDAEQVQELARHHRDLGGVDAVGAEHGAAPALGALVEVEEPLLDDVESERPRPHHPAEELPGGGEVVAVDGPEQLGAQDRHVLRVAAADVEVALVRARPAAHADVHEHPERAVLADPLPDAVEDDLLPVGGELPVLFERRPLTRVREADVLELLRLRGVDEVAVPDVGRLVHPVLLRDAAVVELHELVPVVVLHLIRLELRGLLVAGLGSAGHAHDSFSRGRPASRMRSRNSSSYSSYVCTWTGWFHGFTCRTSRLFAARLRVGERKTPAACMSLLNGKYASRTLTRNRW